MASSNKLMQLVTMPSTFFEEVKLISGYIVCWPHRFNKGHNINITIHNMKWKFFLIIGFGASLYCCTGWYNKLIGIINY